MHNYNTQTRLKDLRRAKHMTQDELAQRAGVNRTTVARWESTNRGMSLESAIKVAAALGCSVSDLVNPVGPVSND